MSEVAETIEASDGHEEASKTRSTRATARRGRSKKTSSVREVTEQEIDETNEEQEISEKEDTQNTEEPDKTSEEETAVNGDVESSNNQITDDNKTQTEQVSSTDADVNDVPELDEAPPPIIVTTSRTLKLRTSFSTGDNEETESKKEEEVEKIEDDNQIPEEFTVLEEVASDSDDVQEVPVEKMEVDTTDTNKTSSHIQTFEGMTVIDEVIDDSDKKDSSDTKQDNNLEPDTEMVSEDELPAEVSKEPLETEAVSDEELPTSGDLPETEAVSEDELPPEGSEKKKKKRRSTPSLKSTDENLKKETGESDGTKKESSKRKLVDGEYDPSSPTSEASDDSPAAKKAAIDGKSATKLPAKPKVLPELEKYWKAVRDDPTDFTGWTYLLQYVDQENDVEAAREAYNSFLSHYPYCYGYWRKYADYEKRKENKAKCEEVFERGLKAIPLSVDLWLHYLNYCKDTFADNEEFLRNSFEKAIEACGLEFRSDRIWEAYLKWESSLLNHVNVTKLYDRLLATPTHDYENHFNSFCTHVHKYSPNKILPVDEFLILRQDVLRELTSNDFPLSENTLISEDDPEAPPGEELPGGEVEAVLASPEETATLRERIIAKRRKIHSATKDAVSARQTYEEGIKRPYFHFKPLEKCQLKNWKDYLEYEISQGDQKRIIVLFERCLIPCALYEEFWLWYLNFLEERASHNITKIRSVYKRACTVYHEKKPRLHLNWAVFEEMQGNYNRAANILMNLEKNMPNLIQVSYRRINLARRSGRFQIASKLYEQYIDNVKNRTIANNFAIKYARFTWKVLNDIGKAIYILKKALEKDEENPRLYLQLIDMAMQRTPLNESEVVSVIDLFLSRETAELEQKVIFAQRKIEVLEDFGSSVKSVQKATDEFQKLWKQLQEKKKKGVGVNKMKQNEPTLKKTKPVIKVRSEPTSSQPTAASAVLGKIKIEPNLEKIKPEIKDSPGPPHVGLPSQVVKPTPASVKPGYTASPEPGYRASNYNDTCNQLPLQNNYQDGYNNQQPPCNQPPENDYQNGYNNQQLPYNQPPQNNYQDGYNNQQPPCNQPVPPTNYQGGYNDQRPPINHQPAPPHNHQPVPINNHQPVPLNYQPPPPQNFQPPPPQNFQPPPPQNYQPPPPQNYQPTPPQNYQPPPPQNFQPPPPQNFQPPPPQNFQPPPPHNYQPHPPINQRPLPPHNHQPPPPNHQGGYNNQQPPVVHLPPQNNFQGGFNNQTQPYVQPPQINFQGGFNNNQNPPYIQPSPLDNFPGGYNNQQPPYNQAYDQNDPNYNNCPNWNYSEPNYPNY